LAIFDDRIGIQTRTGIRGTDVRSIAQDEGLTIRRSFYPGIFELELDAPLSSTRLSELARKLEVDYADKIGTAGFVVQTANSSVPWILKGEILAVIKNGLSTDETSYLLSTYPFDKIEPVYGIKSIFVITVKDDSIWNILTIAGSLLSDTTIATEEAHPSFVIPIMPRSRPPASGEDGTEPDPRLQEQWHHNNRGVDDATLDADIDSMEAWQLSTGDATTPLLAIVDSGFSVTHPDLVGNLWTDDAGNVGHNFADEEEPSLLDDPVYPNTHGTAVAGIAGAIANNSTGGRGVCPGCKLLLLRHDGNTDSAILAFGFAMGKGADVISNSWSPEGEHGVLIETINIVTGNNIPVLFATSSVTNRDRCNASPLIDLSSLSNVIAVSSVTNQDKRGDSGYGDCVDVLAPSRRGNYYGITTTGVFHDPDSAAGGVFDGPLVNFGGTSAATPMVTGTIGLMLDVKADLSALEIQRVLQDTADKVEPCKGQYDSDSGFSNPENSSPTHGYGRINAFEAVSLVAPFDSAQTDRMKRGHGGKDLVLRDHGLDWGNTINPSSELFTPTEPRKTISIKHSVDIKIGANTDGATVQTSTDFNNLDASYVPIAGEGSRAYVRVRNRGPEKISNAMLRLYWTAQRPLPRLQSDFWTAFPNSPAPSNSPTSWNPLPAKTLSNIMYSDTMISDSVRIEFFFFSVEARSAGKRRALLAVVHSADEDPVLAHVVSTSPGDLHDVETAVAWDNNVSLWVSGEPKQFCGGGPLSPALLVLLAILVIRRAIAQVKKRTISTIDSVSNRQ